MLTSLLINEPVNSSLPHHDVFGTAQPSIRLIGFDNQKGLTKDIKILQRELILLGAAVEFLEINEKISVSKSKKIYSFTKALVQHTLPYRRNHRISIFLERIVPELLGESQVNLLIPNPEWFHPAWRFLAGPIDAVLCKTHHAESIYRSLGFKTRYLGFTSPDRALGHHASQRPTFLHIAGGSHFKGTAQLVKTWEKHPEWPLLTVVTHRIMADYVSCAHNVRIMSQFIPESELTVLQNETLFHVYPSQAEGFGHCINEAMSCRAIVLTNDAAPMNELVSDQEGFLLPCKVNGRNCLSHLVDFDEDQFVSQINAAISEPIWQQQLKSTQARIVYEARENCFRTNLAAIIADYSGD